MRNRLFFLILLFFSLVAGSAHTEETQTASPSAPVVQRSADVNTPRGTLYRVRHHNHTCYLFGTIHIGTPDFFPLEQQVTTAFANADIFVLEVDLRDTQAVQQAAKKYGMYPENDSLDKHLSASALKQLKLTLDSLGIPLQSVAVMKPWMLANFLLLATLERQGYRPDMGTEAYLLRMAETQGKRVGEMETLEFQLSLFSSLTDAQQEQYLTDNLDELQSELAMTKARKLFDAWGAADQPAFDALLREAQEDKTFSGKFFMEFLLDKRNPDMATKVEKLLKQEKNSFAGIGLLHLMGRNGVPSLLARRGYQVTRIY